MFAVMRWILGLLVVTIAGLALVNAFDAKLRPEAEQYAHTPLPVAPPEENSFYSMLGFFAPVGTDPHEFGMAAAARYEAELPSATESSSFDVYKDVGKLVMVDWDKPVCGQKNPETTCLDSVSGNVELVRKALRSNALLLERYATLYSYPRYSASLTPHYSSPIATGGVLPTHALWLAGVALQIKDGKVEPVLEALENDVKFWRGIAAQPVSLIDKVVSFAVIARDARLISDLVRTSQLDETQQQRAENLVVSLTPEEKSLAVPVREEFRLMFGLLHQADVLEGVDVADSLGALKHPLYKRNATANQLYEIHQDYLALAEMPPAEFLQQEPVILERRQETFEIYNWRSLYNPIGRILLGVTVQGRYPHPARVHDLEGLLRLVSLQLSMAKANLRPEQIAPFVARATGAHADPYTGEAMKWDPADRRLSFTGYGTSDPESIWIQL